MPSFGDARLVNTRLQMVRSRKSMCTRLVTLGMALVCLAFANGCGGGSEEDDRESVVRRVNAALAELGAPPSLRSCLTSRLDRDLTDGDAEAAFEDLSSEPEVSEKSLNRVSLLGNAVKSSLLSTARRCRSSAIERSSDSRAHIDVMLRRIGQRGFQDPDFFLQPSSAPPR
jgi:hypothetical protein